MFKKIYHLVICGILSILWVVFFALRYLVFQKSVSLGDGIKNHLTNLKTVLWDFHYYDDWTEAVWKIAGWLGIFLAIAFILMLVLTGIFKLKPLCFVMAGFCLLGLIPYLDFCGNSGDYFYYMERFQGKNYFYFFGILGFLIFGGILITFIISFAGLGLREDKTEDGGEEVANEN